VIEKAQRMGIIVPSSEGPEKPITFSHELVRQTLLADTAAPRRQYLTPAWPLLSSDSIPGPSTSARGRSLTISSRRDRSLTAKEWSVG